MLLKGCLHTHTTCSDGTLTPQEVADAYADLGYDFIAYTDHDSLLCQEAEQIYDQVRSSLILFRGMELTVFEKGYVHINRIEGDKDVLYILNHPAGYGVSVEELLEMVNSLSQRFPLDAVEITWRGLPYDEYDVPLIPLPKVASDDAHTRTEIGKAWIELDCKRSKDSIIRAVRRGHFWNCYLRGNG